MPLVGFLNVEFSKLMNVFKFEGKPRDGVVKSTKLGGFEEFMI